MMPQGAGSRAQRGAKCGRPSAAVHGDNCCGGAVNASSANSAPVRILEQIAAVPQIHDEAKASSQERVSERISEQIVNPQKIADEPSPQITENTVEATQLDPLERIQEQMMEEGVDAPFPQLLEKISEVVMLIPQRIDILVFATWGVNPRSREVHSTGGGKNR